VLTSIGDKVMLFAFLICAAGLVSDQPAAKSVESLKAANLAAAYEQAKRDASRSPDDHVRLALWCEAHEMETERQKHLTIALLKEPGHAAARGLMGLVNFRDQWHSPDSVRDHVQANASEMAIRVQPVFNLTVLNGHSYFAGSRKLLVHDSSPVEPVIGPFDAVALDLSVKLVDSEP
jgi:hypothetical protein